MKSSKDLLTPREKEILTYFCYGYTMKEIGYYLHLSWKTPEKHLHNIRTKLNLFRYYELYSFAEMNGLIKPRREINYDIPLKKNNGKIFKFDENFVKQREKKLKEQY